MGVKGREVRTPIAGSRRACSADSSAAGRAAAALASRSRPWRRARSRNRCSSLRGGAAASTHRDRSADARAGRFAPARRWGGLREPLCGERRSARRGHAQAKRNRGSAGKEKCRFLGAMRHEGLRLRAAIDLGSVCRCRNESHERIMKRPISSAGLPRASRCLGGRSRQASRSCRSRRKPWPAPRGCRGPSP